MAIAEERLILRVSALDKINRSIGLNHTRTPKFDSFGYGSSSSGFGAYEIEVFERKPQGAPDQTVLVARYEGKGMFGGRSSGFHGFGRALAHNLKVDIYKTDPEDVLLDAPTIGADEFDLLPDVFAENREGELGVSKLIVPLFAGQLTLSLYAAPEFPREQTTAA